MNICGALASMSIKFFFSHCVAVTTNMNYYCYYSIVFVLYCIVMRNVITKHTVHEISRAERGNMDTCYILHYSEVFDMDLSH